MSFHAFIEYLKYRWVAKGRHGTHSPFVYDMVESVLLNSGSINREFMVAYPQLSLRYENLISRLAAHYNYKTIVRLPKDNEAKMVAEADVLLLGDPIPQRWVELMNKNAGLLGKEGAVIAVGIHKTTVHTKAWEHLYKDARVRMSIDLYGIGVLFFRDDFKVPQHFVLKY